MKAVQDLYKYVFFANKILIKTVRDKYTNFFFKLYTNSKTLLYRVTILKLRVDYIFETKKRINVIHPRKIHFGNIRNQSVVNVDQMIIGHTRKS